MSIMQTAPGAKRMMGARRMIALGATAVAGLALALSGPLTAQTMPDPAMNQQSTPQPGTLAQEAMTPPTPDSTQQGVMQPSAMQPGAPGDMTSPAGPVRQTLPEPAPTARAAPTEATSGLPYCSRSVKDRCIQRGDVRRQG